MEAPVRMLKVEEAAGRYGRSVRTVRRWCELGQVEGAVKRGKTWFVPEGASVTAAEDGQLPETPSQRAAALQALAETAVAGMQAQVENALLREREVLLALATSEHTRGQVEAEVALLRVEVDRLRLHLEDERSERIAAERDVAVLRDRAARRAWWRPWGR